MRQKSKKVRRPMVAEEGMTCSSSRCRHGCMMSSSHPCYSGCANQVLIETPKK